MSTFKGIEHILKDLTDKIDANNTKYTQVPANEIKKIIENAGNNGKDMSDKVYATQLWSRFLIDRAIDPGKINVDNTQDGNRDHASIIEDIVDPGQIELLAQQFIKSSIAWQSENPKSPSKTTINLTHLARPVANRVIELAEEKNLNFDLYFNEANRHATLLNKYGDKAFKILKEEKMNTWSTSDKLIMFKQNVPSDIILSEKAKDLFSKLTGEWMDKLKNGDLFYTLTILPTPEDAKRDGFSSYDDYLNKIFFPACHQPWEAIEKAHDLLIDKLDTGNMLHITNNDGTDISLDITDMTFANSSVAKNIPWSEVFSSPNKQGVNGKVVAKGKFKYIAYPGIVENITLEYKDGKCISYKAETGQETLDAIMNTDAWTRRVGEIGIWTNPHLQQHLMNALLVEKVSGSFHLAIGNSYKFKKYWWKKVKVDNGNKSKIHRDITTMLKWKDGVMILDGVPLQKNGLRLDPELTVLNQGRWAIKKEKQPDRWKKDFPNGYK